MDSISQKYEVEETTFSITFIVVDWLNHVHKEWLIDHNITTLIQQLQIEPPWIYVHFCFVQDPFKLKAFTQINFMDNIFKLHGIPHLTIMDCDHTFTIKMKTRERETKHNLLKFGGHRIVKESLHNHIHMIYGWEK